MQNIKRYSASLLVIWLSGAVFLFCCQMMPETQASASESCPLSKKGNCSLFVSIPREQNALDCCKVPAKVFDKVRKLEKNQEEAKLADKVIVRAPKFFLAKSNFETPKFYPQLVRDRGSTFLENCVFLI